MRVTLYPVPGRLARHPATKQPIPDEGIEVEKDSFWARRLKDGDVTETNPNPRPTRQAAKSDKE